MAIWRPEDSTVLCFIILCPTALNSSLPEPGILHPIRLASIHTKFLSHISLYCGYRCEWDHVHIVHMGAKPWYSLNHLPPISLQFLCWGRILQHCLGWPLTHSVAQVGFESVCFNCLSSCNCAWPHNPAAPLWKGPTHNSGLTWLSSQDSGLSFSLSSISL